SLDGLWQFHPGDDPRWADPAFDDSAWPLLRSDRPWSVQGYPGMSGYAWYRFTLRAPAGSPPVSLLLPPITSGYTLYVDGRNAGSAGNSDPQLFIRYPQSQSFHLTTVSDPAPRTLHLALRVWHSPIWASYVGAGPLPAFPAWPGTPICWLSSNMIACKTRLYGISTFM
ncbi:MAG TPA: hypothetical protein VH139_10210, partial [Acidobacteriaceae bacterium]|nr:hypothetical protein [Acidobacteriaceae bacterium]